MNPTLCLDGLWQLTCAARPDLRLPAPVPGSVHDALLDAGVVPDVHQGYAERDQLWVGSVPWTYTRTFVVTGELLACRRIDLVCEGLDTLCRVLLNGRQIGTADNMFRTWRFPLAGILKDGENELRLEFDSVEPLMARRTAERLLPAWNEADINPWGPVGRGYVRKQSCQFGWDWGPQCPSAGPWRTLRIEGWNQGRIDDWRVTQTHLPDGAVDLAVFLQPDQPTSLRARGILRLEGNVVAECEEAFWGGWEWRIRIEEPRRWWPSGMGEQALYELELTLCSEEGNPLEVIRKRIGLRTIEIDREADAWGHAFRFRVNGRPFFAKGANWIPPDAHGSSRNLVERFRRDLLSARDAHMNLLRVWGGGYFPAGSFYDLCDELGILIWQDLLFGCGAYPIWDEGFRESVWRETVDNARRLRHHASLACWCGNNELEMGFTEPAWLDNGVVSRTGKMAWASYLELFERVLPSALALADPATPYVRGSPHCHPADGRDGNSERSGDQHFWEVWFNPVPFERYRSVQHRFLSEFGFQSMPDADLLRSVAPLDETLSVNSEWLAFRQRSQPGNARVAEMTVQWFGEEALRDFDRFCVLSQITQGEALRIGIEYWRASYPRCAGATYWQLNDRWAASTWATLDCRGRWKAGHHFAKRFFAPLLVLALEDPATGAFAVRLVNDRLQSVPGELLIEVYSRSGERLGSRRRSLVAAPECAVTDAGSYGLAELAGPGVQPGEVIVWLEFTPKDLDLPKASNTVLFARPANLRLPPATLNWKVSPGSRPDQIEVQIANGATPALWVHVEPHPAVAQADGNFTSLRPRESLRIRLRLEKGASAADVVRTLRVSAAEPLSA